MWVLPTYSRPEQCAEVLKRIRNSGCTSMGMLFVNGSEEYAKGYLKIVREDLRSEREILPENWGVWCVSGNYGCLGALNKVFEKFPDEPWYGFIADDEMLIEAPRDWDRRLIDSAGRWGIAHGTEDWNGGKRCQGYPVWGGELVRAVGYWALPGCWHNFGLDSMWEWLFGRPQFGGGGLGSIVCLPEIRIEHGRAKPGVTDGCYKLADSQMEDDRRAFWDWCVKYLQSVAKRVREERDGR